MGVIYTDTFAVIPVITGVVQAFKVASLPSKFAGLLSIVLGVLFSVGVNKAVTFETVFMGVVFGLAASGFYEGAKLGTSEAKSLIKKVGK